MNNALKQEGDTITLCCIYPFMPCCPKLRKDSGNYIIEDDYGQEIILSESDMDTVIHKLNEITSMPRSSLDT